MKKKFDFTAEMKEAQVTKSTPQNEYLEEEKRLLGICIFRRIPVQHFR